MNKYINRKTAIICCAIIIVVTALVFALYARPSGDIQNTYHAPFRPDIKDQFDKFGGKSYIEKEIAANNNINNLSLEVVLPPKIEEDQNKEQIKVQLKGVRRNLPFTVNPVSSSAASATVDGKVLRWGSITGDWQIDSNHTAVDSTVGFTEFEGKAIFSTVISQTNVNPLTVLVFGDLKVDTETTAKIRETMLPEKFRNHSKK